MKLNALAALLFLVASPLFAKAPETRSEDEKAIRGVVAHAITAWNAKNAADFASLWAEDGDLIHPDGHLDQGRAAIQKTMSKLFSSTFADTTVTGEIQSIRFLKPDIAVLDMAWNLEGTARFADGDTMENPSYHILMVFQKLDGKWQKQTVRPYMFQKQQ